MSNSQKTISEIINFCSTWGKTYKIYFPFKSSKLLDVEVLIFLFWNVREYCIKEKAYDKELDIMFQTFLYDTITQSNLDFGDGKTIRLLLTTRYNMYPKELKNLFKKNSNYIPLNLYRAFYVDALHFVRPALLCDYSYEDQQDIKKFGEK